MKINLMKIKGDGTSPDCAVNTNTKSIRYLDFQKDGDYYIAIDFSDNRYIASVKEAAEILKTRPELKNKRDYETN